MTNTDNNFASWVDASQELAGVGSATNNTHHFFSNNSYQSSSMPSWKAIKSSNYTNAATDKLVKLIRWTD